MNKHSLSIDQKQTWFFTFGSGHPHPITFEPMDRRFVMVENTTYGEARNKMVEVFDDKWAFQYNTHQFKDSIKRFGLVEFKLQGESNEKNLS